MKKIRIYYLALGEIVELNRQIVRIAGGSRGSHKEADLEFLDYKLRDSFNFENLRESLLRKSAFIIYFMNHLSHTFSDGNKRTSIEMAKLLLRLNGYDLTLPLEESKKFILEVSQYKHDEKSISKWLAKRITKHKLKKEPSIA